MTMLEALKKYQALLWILVLCILVATAVEYRQPEWSYASWMHSFMGIFFVQFSLFKLVDLRGFVAGYQKYDLLAKKSAAYAYLYPFIELGLGLLYLSEEFLIPTYWATIAIMLFGFLGILKSLRAGYQFNCACLGTILKVKLSQVSIIENLGMAAMAAGMLWMS
jgi:hypothetical protein